MKIYYNSCATNVAVEYFNVMKFHMDLFLQIATFETMLYYELYVSFIYYCFELYPENVHLYFVHRFEELNLTTFPNPWNFYSNEI